MQNSELSELDVHQLGDTLNRLVKLALDSGEAASVKEAMQQFMGYRLHVAVGAIGQSVTQQAALLTVVNTGRRAFLGGVRVSGDLDIPLLLPWNGCATVRQAVENLGGQCVTEPLPELPTVCIGGTLQPQSEFCVSTTFEGWCGAVVPYGGETLAQSQEFTPAGVLAGALAVSEAFQFVRGKNAAAGRRRVGLSLWRPECDPWSDVEAAGPALTWLPSKLWLIGLGHLGQAYLWTLGFLPYAASAEVELVLQDQDALQPSNDSTSVLTHAGLIGQNKTRAMAAWCQARGFKSRIVERRFAGDFQVQADEPRIALCGVDNPQARACLQDVGFAEIIEAGLGSTGESYLNLQMHTFAGNENGQIKTARSIWGEETAPSSENAPSLGLAYQNLKESSGDICGVTQLAGRAVGASFVGVIASTLVVAELLRISCGAHRYSVADLNLRTPERLKIFARTATETLNLGVTQAL